MPRFSAVEARRWGDPFMQFLRDTGREQENWRETLRSIYNQEFGGSWMKEGPETSANQKDKVATTIGRSCSYSR